MEDDTEVHFKEQFFGSLHPLLKHATLAQPMAYVWGGANR